MTNTDVQIDWSVAGTSNAVEAARRAMRVGGKPVYRAAKKPPVVEPQPVVDAISVVPASAGLAEVAVPDATASVSKTRKARNAADRPSFYAMMTLLVICLGVAGVWKANVAFAPEMYAENGMVPVAEAHAAGQNYAVFDLNLNIRRWKEELVARLDHTPDLVVVGASQWQEAHAGLVQSERMFNGHIHRDYWEDILSVVEVYARNNRLPKRMIIAVRDKQFTPVELRQDFLWEPGIANYRKMADRLGIEKEDAWKTYPFQRMKERLSLTMLINNVTRWFNAEDRPHPTSEQHFQHLDTLLPDGSILWSADHLAFFTPERMKREALALADIARNSPPAVDPLGVQSFDTLLAFLKKQGVQVILAHPPYNPVFYDAVQNSKFMPGLENIRKITKDLAAKYGLHVIGEFDPVVVGCTAEQYIDAEHSSPPCLQKIFDQYEALLPQLRLEEQKGQI